jgi:hypothetical protein
MKKRINTHAITNELKESSIFFRRHDHPEPEQPQQTNQPPNAPVLDQSRIVQDNQKTLSQQPIPPSFRPKHQQAARPVRPVRRLTRRHAFEFYDDQIEGLRRLSIQDRMQGGDGSMSRMVREAIDRFVAAEEGKEEYTP